MKLRKILSWFVAAAVILANTAIISAPPVSAETVVSETAFSEDFEGFANTNYSPTLTALKDYGWYVADNNTLYTEVSNVAPYSTYNGKFAQIATVDGGKVLVVSSAGEGDSTQNADTPKYGYAKTFPGVAPGEAATGSWEITFDFKPYLDKTTHNTQFAFTLNTGDGTDMSETAAQHNIIAGYKQRFYMGYRDYNALLNNGVQPGTLKAVDIGGDTWYTVKTFLNCDARYYTVELYNRSSGKLIARRSPISFDASESIGFLKFSALGFSQKSYVFVDNISIEKAGRDTCIYDEDFEAFSNNNYAAETGMTTGETSEDIKGSSYFEGYTPWRFHKDIGNSYNLEIDPELTSQVVRLGDKPETTEDTEASGLIYMQPNEPLVTQATQPLRGILQMGFKIKPETIAEDFTVNVLPDPKIDIKAQACEFFKIVNDEGTTKFLKSGGDFAELDPSTWYDVTQTFDVAERTVSTVVRDLEGNIVATGFAVGTSTPYAVRAFMFKAEGGTSVLIDDIKLQYYVAAPFINVNNIVLTDSFGEKVTDINNVTTALKTIEIPAGCPSYIDASTANSSTILLRDSTGYPVPYTGSVSGNSYIMTLDETPALNEEYTVTIPETFANISGVQLGEEVTFTFKTTEAIADISAVSVNGEPYGSLLEITAGSTVNVAASYKNTTQEAVNGTVILAFFNGNKINYIKALDSEFEAGGSGVDETSFEFTIPSDFDIDAVDSLSVFIWTRLHELKPLSRKISLNNKIETTGKFNDYVDFAVNIESGREPVILQLTDTQIMDSSQRREEVSMSTAGYNYWLPQNMNLRLFNDLRLLINQVKPDLILLTGDLVYGGYDDEGTSFKKLADFLDGYGIPWAPVFGNHDNESKMGVDWQCNYLESCKNCLFKQRALTGNGNYSIGIVQGGELKRVIFMLDSNGCAVMSDESFANGHSKKSAGFGDDQIDWYTDAAEKINEDFENMKYTFAFHIQLAAFEDALATYGFDKNAAVIEEGTGKGDFIEPINIDEREDKKDTDFGYIGRKLKGAWDESRAVYSGMKAIGVDSILVGHEHCNSASVVYDGVRFQYGQKIGEYDRINFKDADGKYTGAIAYAPDLGTPVLGGTVMKLSEETGEISNAYIHYCKK